MGKGYNQILKNIFVSEELLEHSVVSVLETTAKDGKKYKTKHFNLDAVLSVGYRINSKQATHFRQWATKILREHITRGYRSIPNVSNLLIRGEKVMLDAHLAILYGVQTKTLVQAIKRNIDRFPTDFMFQLTQHEFQNLRSQSVTSSWGGRRYLPYVFTEQGVAMLSSVLHSKQAIQVNIEIMRAFVRFRQLTESHKDLKQNLQALEKKYDKQFKVIFEAIHQLMMPSISKKRPIGFHSWEDK